MIFIHQDTSIGPLLIAGEEHAIHAIHFAKKGRAEDPPASWTRSSRGAVAEAARQLREYFEGRRQEFDLPLKPEGSPFERRVWDVTRRVKYGTVVSYGTLAARIGVPGGARAVGNALGKNPVPIVVPCHRVIHGDKSIGGFSSGLKWKRFLLELERGQLEVMDDEDA